LSNGAKVILTTSGTHDPAEKTMIPPPVHADAFWLAHPDRDPGRNPSLSKAAGQAYSASKLCNLLTARGLKSSPEAIERRLRVIAFRARRLAPGSFATAVLCSALLGAMLVHCCVFWCRG
jgi:hypothetical protein